MSNSAQNSKEVPVRPSTNTATNDSSDSRSNISPSRKRVNDIESVLHALAAGKTLVPIAKSMGCEINGLNRRLAIYGLQAVRFLDQKGVGKQEIVHKLTNKPDIQKAFGTSGFEATRLKVTETAKVLEHLAAKKIFI